MNNDNAATTRVKVDKRHRRGVATLKQLGLLTQITRLKKAPLSTTGLTKINRYLLYEPFSRLLADDIVNDEMIDALVYPAAPKKRSGKIMVCVAGKRAKS